MYNEQISWALERAQTPAIVSPSEHVQVPERHLNRFLRASFASLPHKCRYATYAFVEKNE